LTLTNSDLRKEYSELRDLERSKEKENLDLKDKINNLDLTLTQNNYEIKGLKGSIDEYKIYIENMTVEFDDTQKQLRDAVFDLNNKNDKLKERENDINNLKDELAMLLQGKNETETKLRKTSKNLAKCSKDEEQLKIEYEK